MNLFSHKCALCGKGRGTRRYTETLSSWGIRVGGYAHPECVKRERERRARGLFVVVNNERGVRNG